MGKSSRRRKQQQQQQQQQEAQQQQQRVLTTLDVCLTCLKGEEWCFAVGEVGHVAPDQPPPWQERKEPEHPARVREDPHPPRRKNPVSSEGIWDWLADPERDIMVALPAVINLLWARDGERWETWEQQHHPASLPDIAAMVLNYLAADMRGVPPSPGKKGEAPLPSLAPEGEEPPLPSPATKGEEPERPTPEWEEPERPTPEWEEPERPTPEWEEPERPTPPAEGEYLLVPHPPSWEGLLLSCFAPPKDACFTPPKDACCSASPGAACCSASPGAACCSASPGAAFCSAQGTG
ncbi:UNVERIFIED_CONTAM: hypothetical protein FKN15_017445 [Acipenser sinensis]